MLNYQIQDILSEISKNECPDFEAQSKVKDDPFEQERVKWVSLTS